MIGIPARWPLKAILFGQLLLASLMPLLVVAVFMLVKLQPQLLGDIGEQKKLLAGAMAGQIETHLDSAERELTSLAAVVSDVPMRGRGAVIERQLDAVVRRGELYETIYLVDADFRVVAVGLPSARRTLREDLRLIDLSRRDFVRVAAAEGKAVWSPAFLSVLSGRLTVAVALPVQGGRVLVGELALAKLSDFLRQLRSGAEMQSIVLDPWGNVIAHPEPGQTGQQISLVGLGLVRDAFANGSTFGVATLDAKELVGAALKIHQTGWVVFVGQQEEEAYRSIGVVVLVMLIGFLFALFFATVAAALAARNMGRRFGHYADNAAALARGQYKLYWPDTQIREFAALGEDLQKTASAIQQRETALKESEKRFRTLIEQSPVAVIEWSLDFMVREWNEAAEKTFGHSRVNAVGRRGDFIIPDDERSVTDDVWRRLCLAEGGWRNENVNLTADGRRITCQWYNRTIVDDHGVPVAVLSLVEDVTEARRAQQEIRDLNATLEQRVASRTEALGKANQELTATLDTLRHAQNELVRSEKFAALGALVAGVAHELNTPIGNSLMAASTLEEHVATFSVKLGAGPIRRSELDQYVRDSEVASDIIVRNLNKASELVTSFKQVAVDQASAQRRDFLLDEVVSEILMTLRPSFKRQPIDVQVSISETIRLDSYPGPLGQVLSNLLNNARIHAFDGRASGNIRLSARMLSSSEVRLEVSDDGVGIPAKYLGRIFDPFFTTRLGKGGSGLGLHIAHNIVTRVLGGRIGVTSTPAGSTFWLEIPLMAPQPSAEQVEGGGA